MTVLKVLHGNVRARSSLETGVTAVVIGGALTWVAEKISLIDAGAACAEGWQEMDNRLLVEARSGTINAAASEAIVASILARSRVNHLHFLNPSVSGCLAKNGGDSSQSKCELHFGVC